MSYLFLSFFYHSISFHLYFFFYSSLFNSSANLQHFKSSNLFSPLSSLRSKSHFIFSLFVFDILKLCFFHIIRCPDMPLGCFFHIIPCPDMPLECAFARQKQFLLPYTKTCHNIAIKNNDTSRLFQQEIFTTRA